MAAEVVDWLRGSKASEAQVNSAINDAIDTEFKSLIRASLSILMGGPTDLTISAAAERTTLITIANPTSGPGISETDADDPTLAVHSVRAAYTYATESGTETLPSPETDYTTSGLGKVAVITHPQTVTGAIGWNLYASGSPTGTLVKQNDEPFALNTSYTEPDGGFTFEPNDPEPPSENTTGDNIFYIRHMEVQTTNGVLKAWNNADIDSDFMRRQGLTIAGTSEYQSYAYDLINQRQLEIRPTMGATLRACYFFIVKPRRLAFSNSPLPFPTVPDTKFIRCQALSDIFLALREYKASESWQKKADTELASCVLAITAMNRPKNQRVTPFRT